MKYCINYAKDFRFMDEVDEIILNHYSGSDFVIEFVPKLVKENKSQRIIVNLLDIKTDKISEPIIYIAKLIHDGYNMAAIILDKKEIIDMCKENNVPFFFSKHATNLETAYSMAEMGVSDVYVVEELGFRIKDLKYLKDKYNIKIRVFPNIAQSAKNSIIKPMERFWIRPEDTELYEPYVDVFELLSGEDTSRLSVVYEIYKQRQWLGTINDLILDFQEPIVPNTGISPHFGDMRLNCGKRCHLGRCNICTQMISFAEAFDNAGLEIVKKRYKPEYTEEDYEKAKELYKKIKERKENEPRSDQESDNNEPEPIEQNSL